MKPITPKAARLENYSEISVPINPRTEPQIFASMEASLAGADAVWLDHGNGTFSAARRTSDLILDPPRAKRAPLAVELLITEDDRRERVTVEAHEGFLHSIATPAPQPFDELDLAAADETPAERVLRVLDELQRKENPKP